MGQVVADEDGQANRTDQLKNPRDVTMDKMTDSRIICDSGNHRVVRWSRRNTTNGQTIISDIDCHSLVMDNNGDLYVSDCMEHDVRR
jgi:hypothetical protein